MKTTNKLLIGLAITLFVVPVGAMVIWAKSNRLDASAYRQAIEVETKEFGASDKYLVKTKLEKFDKISLSSSKNTSVNLYLIKSNDYGFKIEEGSVDKFIHEIVADGKLIIKTKPDAEFFQTSIYIFAPEFSNVELSTIHIPIFEAKMDSLHLVLNDFQSMNNFGEGLNLNKLKMTLNTSSLKLNSVNKARVSAINTILLDLTNSSIALAQNQYNYIDATLNNSGITYMSENNDNKFFIKDFNVNAQGNSTIGLFNKGQIGRITGSVSDSTSVLMPVYLYKNLLIK